MNPLLSATRPIGIGNRPTDLNVALERSATALYVTKQTNLGHDGSLRSRTECIHRLKPHVSLAAAAEATQEADRLDDQTYATGKAWKAVCTLDTREDNDTPLEAEVQVVHAISDAGYNRVRL